jgi:integrase/recombinase XerD
MSLVPEVAWSTDLMTAESPAERLGLAFLLAYQGATREGYGRDLRRWFAWCASHDVEPLAAQRAHVDAYARTLAEVPDEAGKTLSPTTVARHLSTKSGFYRYAVNEDVVNRNPVAAVRRPKVGTDTVSTGLDRDELAALVHVAETDLPRSLALVLLLGLNGLRISEALGADVSDLDTERGHRVLRIKRKGGKGSTIPLAPRTAEAVESYVGDRTAGPLFVTVSGRRWHRQGRGRRSGGSRGRPSQRRPTPSILMTSGTPS